jgi:hypothetical protein
MKRIDRLVPWIVGAFVLTAVIAGMYLTAQNIERSGADDAGQRLASQVASSTDSTADVPRVDLAQSLAPFFVIYDTTGNPTGGSGYLDGKLASVPKGVITTAVAQGSDHVSWQPRVGLRFAVIAVADGDRVVLAGQSLKPSENRTDQLGLLLLLGWAGSIVLLAVGTLVHLRAARDFC